MVEHEVGAWMRWSSTREGFGLDESHIDPKVESSHVKINENFSKYFLN